MIDWDGLIERKVLVNLRTGGKERSARKPGGRKLFVACLFLC